MDYVPFYDWLEVPQIISSLNILVEWMVVHYRPKKKKEKKDASSFCAFKAEYNWKLHLVGYCFLLFSPKKFSSAATVNVDLELKIWKKDILHDEISYFSANPNAL